jgi:hypothetical protein
MLAGVPPAHGGPWLRFSAADRPLVSFESRWVTRLIALAVPSAITPSGSSDLSACRSHRSGPDARDGRSPPPTPPSSSAALLRRSAASSLFHCLGVRLPPWIPTPGPMLPGVVALHQEPSACVDLRFWRAMSASAGRVSTSSRILAGWEALSVWHRNGGPATAEPLQSLSASGSADTSRPGEACSGS